MIQRHFHFVFLAMATVGSVHCATNAETHVANTESAQTACSEAGYAAWIQATLKPAIAAVVAAPTDANIGALAALEPGAAELPCATRDSYVAWLPFFSALYAPVVTRRAALGTAGVRSTFPTEAEWEGRYLTATEARVLAALKKSAPPNGDEGAYAVWQTVFDPAVESAVATLYTGTLARATLVQDAWVIDAREEELLQTLEALRPSGNQIGAWAAWFKAYGKATKSITSNLDSEASVPGIEARFTAGATRLARNAPNPTDELAYLLWFEQFGPAFTSDNARGLMVISAARPLRSGGDKPYKTWLGTVLEPARVTAYTSTSPDSRAKAEAEIATLLTVKPCTGAAGMTLHTTVSGRVAADARLADLLLRAKPELCPAE